VCDRIWRIVIASRASGSGRTCRRIVERELAVLASSSTAAEVSCLLIEPML